MTTQQSIADVLERIRRVRQIRQYRPDPVPAEALARILEIARWTGSSRNTQPWHLIVVDDRALLHQLSQLRPPIAWLADAPLGIAIVLDGQSEIAEAYDEGRLIERILIAANLLGLAGGVAWYGDAAQQAEAKRLLGIPEERTARSIVALGYPRSARDPRPSPVRGGRKPLAEIVSVNRYGQPLQ